MAPFVFIVSNNAAWNIERYDQAENYGGRVVGTTLKHSDYAGMARAFGAYGERVENGKRHKKQSASKKAAVVCAWVPGRRCGDVGRVCDRVAG
jgi:thiamine pyrophosphate-dependent acetolactate synthase large subunit-like protein